MKTVLTFGSFDILHPGHIHYLSKAKSFGDKLIVIVARDKSIMMHKHRHPILDQDARVLIIGSLRMVDRAVLGKKLKKKSDIFNIFKEHKPDVIVLGYDQRVDIPAMKEWLARHKIKAKVVRLRSSVKDDVYKSSKLLARLRENI